MMTLTGALADPELYARVLPPGDWHPRAVALAAMLGEPIASADLALFRRLTGRERPPVRPPAEVYEITGRRGGKSFGAALLTTYLALFRDYAPYLAPGERATVMLLAANRKQARVLMRYVRGILEGVPMFAARVERLSDDAVDLQGRVTVEVHTASFRSLRGYTVAAAICDEVAFWRDDASANPDREILDALRPAMASIPDAVLVAISSPYRRAGVLWEAYRDHWAKDDDEVLVIRAPTRTMNPTLDQKVIDRAYRRDAAVAAAEYGAEFRSDISGFLDPDWIDAATRHGQANLAPNLKEHSYAAFVDPSGGRGDAFALGIAHEEDGRAILDVSHAVRPPFDPTAVVREFSTLLKSYRCLHAVGDRYAGEWVTEAFRAVGIDYRSAHRTKSEIYVETGPLFASGRVEVPDDRELLGELRQLERRTHAGGRESVDHPPRGHDDRANAACGALWLATEGAPVDFTDDMYQFGPRLAATEMEEFR